MLWNQSHNDYKLFAVRLSINTSATQLPNAFNAFNFNDLQVFNLELANPSFPLLPTVMGSSTDQVMYYYPTDNNGNRVGVPLIGQSVRAEIDALSGVNLPGNLLPQAQLQMGLDLPMGHSLSLRLLPGFSLGELEYLNYGFAYQNKFNSWLFKALPVDMYLGAFYNHLSARYDLEIGDPGENLNQHLAFSSSTWGAYLSFSKKIRWITPFVDVNYSQTGNVFQISGLYNFSHNQYTGISGTQLQQVQFSMLDPVYYQVNNQSFAVVAGCVIQLKNFWWQIAAMQSDFFHVGTALGYSFTF